MKKNAELRRIISDEDIECGNLIVNSGMRKTIWRKFEDDLRLADVEIDVQKEDAKKIWDKLSIYLPVYSLFQADRKNHDGDNEVQDPLREAVKQILSDNELAQMLSHVAASVEEKLREVSTRTLDKLREIDPSIASSLNPVIPSAANLKWQDVFKGVSISGDEDIPINKRGSGVKRLVLLNFFRAEAERRFLNCDNTGVIYAIEEPETSQHTANQKVLIEALKILANAENTQVIMTTHSAFLVKQMSFSSLRLIVEDLDRSKQIVNVLPGQLQYPSLNEVNYIAFDEISAEYHDELWSFIEFQNWKNDYIRGQETRPYIKIARNGNHLFEQKVLSEYIRHQIHHPENTQNEPYTKAELNESIDLMRSFIAAKCETGVVYEP